MRPLKFLLKKEFKQIFRNKQIRSLYVEWTLFKARLSCWLSILCTTASSLRRSEIRSCVACVRHKTAISREWGIELWTWKSYNAYLWEDFLRHLWLFLHYSICFTVPALSDRALGRNSFGPWDSKRIRNPTALDLTRLSLSGHGESEA